MCIYMYVCVLQFETTGRQDDNSGAEAGSRLQIREFSTDYQQVNTASLLAEQLSE